MYIPEDESESVISKMYETEIYKNIYSLLCDDVFKNEGIFQWNQHNNIVDLQPTLNDLTDMKVGGAFTSEVLDSMSRYNNSRKPRSMKNCF
jgi:hypothetical protein